MVEQTLVIQINGITTKSFTPGTPFYFYCIRHDGLECDPIHSGVAKFRDFKVALSVLRAIEAYCQDSSLFFNIMPYEDAIKPGQPPALREE